MTKEEMNQYLESIGGLVRTYKVFKGPILTAEYLSVSEGWYDLIKSLIDELIALGWDRRVHQVKEKFGGLRFYVQAATDKHYNFISFAESMSYRTCEECGAPGKRYSMGWHKTLCDIHADMDGRNDEVDEGEE
jgi:hypothetical protein